MQDISSAAFVETLLANSISVARFCVFGKLKYRL